MSRLNFTLLLASSALVAAACHSDSTIVPSTAIQIVGDSVLRVGDTIVLHAEPVPTAGDAVDPIPSVTWGTGDGTIVSVPFSFAYPTPTSVKIIAIKGGTVTVSASTATASASMTLHVVDDRPIATVRPGETITGTIAGGFSQQRFAVTLQAGDTIDFKIARSQTLPSVRLRALDAGFDVTPAASDGVTSIVAGLAAPSAGTFLFDGIGDPACRSGSCTATNGTFTLTLRRSGPVFGLVTRAGGFYQNVFGAPQPQIEFGTGYADTVWVENLGAGTMRVAAVSNASYVGVDRDTVIVAGHTTPYRASSPTPPPGASPLIVRVNASGLGPGSYLSPVQFLIDTSTWNLLGGIATYRVQFRVLQAGIQLLSNQTFDGMAAGPAGVLYGWANNDIYKVDPATGASTKLLTVRGPVRGMGVAPDGTPHWTRGEVGDTILKYVPGTGAVRVYAPLAGAGGSMVFTPDGTMYTFEGSELLRFSPTGTRTDLGPVSHGRHLVYHAGENALYYIGGTNLRRFDLARGVEEVRGAVPAGELTAIDAKGQLYAFPTFITGMHIFDTQGTLLQVVSVPVVTVHATVLGNYVYGAALPQTGGNPNYFWRFPVP